VGSITPELGRLLAVAAAVLDETGLLVEANAGFLRLIKVEGQQPIGAPAGHFFIQPDFASIGHALPGADGEIYRGLLTIGDYLGQTRTVRARIWRASAQLHLLAEVDVEELERLSDAMLDLNRDYAAAQRELVQANLAMRQLNAEIAERTRALADALRTAEAASRAKSAFLANVSHELRTPLNTIMGLGHLIAPALTEPRLRTQFDQIRAAGRQLLETVNQILDMCSLESDTLDLKPVDFALTSVFVAAEELLGERAAAKGLRLTRDIDPALPHHLHGDPDRLRQILATLLGNAIKFSDHGQITLRARLAESRKDALLLRLEVQDQGIGISAPDQRALLENSGQVDSSTTRRYGGLGFGLAICKTLAQLMDGTLGIDSTPGHGSTFWITAWLMPASGAISPVTPIEPTAPASPETLAAQQTADAPQHDMLAVLARLDALLAQGDAAAIDLFEEHAASLGAAYGRGCEPLAHQIRQIDFDAARDSLRKLNATSEPHPPKN